MVLLLELLVLRSSSFLEINPISKTGNHFNGGAEQIDVSDKLVAWCHLYCVTGQQQEDLDPTFLQAATLSESS